MRWGAVLISAGAILWLIQGALLLSALPTVAGGFNLNPSTSSNNTTALSPTAGHTHVWIAEYAVNGALSSLVLATFFAVLASIALVFGTFLIARASGKHGNRAPRPNAETTYALSRGTKAAGVAAGVFIGSFAACGLIAFAILESQGSGPVASNCGAWGDGCPITSALELWIMGSALLLVGAEIFGVFSERVSKETAGHVQIHGALFSNYAIVNFLGLAVVPFAVVMSPSNGGLSDSLLYAALFAQLFVVPITGFVAWSWLSVHGFQSAFRKAGGLVDLDTEGHASWGSGPTASGDPEIPVGGVRAGAPVSPAGLGARSRVVPPLDPDWAQRIQVRMQNLERLVIAQNETISDLRQVLIRLPADRGLTDPTVATRIGGVGLLGQDAETVTVPSRSIPSLDDLGDETGPSENSVGNRTRGVGRPSDKGSRGP